ncbi:hypothetical protein KTI59_15215 [Acinetobacter radioresistens]|uniref:hypothetical protein n=1 Tax=Acinetobacter radioresistens TaxID=40216 RepID=UPI0021CD765E|nr:hypothetical protein [Acinetobacter radioresistens]MCU4501418.1 hypothetical protein [Acinetobacter radioresistens]
MTKHDNVSQEGIMKATEFVKKHGWGETQRIIQDYPSHTHVTSDARMFIKEHSCMEEIKRQLVGLVKISELKRLVESHELVQSYGGLSKSRKWIERTVFKLSDSMIALKKAIADVEACQ